ncbi:MAG TPA: YCF48-related protein [Ignavibacteriaceae bacterium]|nr:YCF48-related protein [Ignavibacteriaceae bacterium]
MKKFLPLFVLLLCFENNYPQEYTPWKWLHQKPQGADVRWVQMLDENNWVAAGMFGLFMKTTDAGQTWYWHPKASHPYSDGDYNMIYIGHFFNKDTGIVGGGDAIRRTTDGGVTWKEIPYTFSSSGIIWGSHFINNRIGYVSGDDSILIQRTTDAGLHWKKLDSAWIDPDDLIKDVWSNDTLIIGALKHGNILRSTDRGQTFQTLNVGATNNLFSVEFKDKNNGWVVGSGGFAAYTTDGGLTWTSVDGLPSYDMNDVDYRKVNGVDQVVVTGSPYYLYGTTNKGQSWTTIAFRPSGQKWTDYMHKTDFLPDGNSYVVVGETGLIYSKIASNDPKCHTQFLKSGILWDVWAENKNGKVIAVGEETNTSANDHIMLSTNGGVDWQIININTNSTLRSISMVNSNVGYIAGTEGTLFKTTDGGYTWNPIITNTTTNFYSCDFISESTGWVVGYGGVVIKTTDGGVTWVSESSTLPASVYDVDFVNENVGWISGGSGLIRKTTNGGENWFAQDPLMDSSTIYALKAVNENLVFVGGSLGKMARSTDGGVTFDSMQTPPQFSTIIIRDMDFRDEKFGVLGATGSKVCTTTDGGLTWKMEFANNTTIFGVDIVDSPDDTAAIFVVGLKGSIIANKTFVVPTILFSDDLSGSPKEYSLEQNYPNPFNPTTSIKYSIPSQQNVEIKVFDVLGNQVAVLVNEVKPAGSYEVKWDANGFSSGLYFYQFKLDSYSETRKMILLK